MKRCTFLIAGVMLAMMPIGSGCARAAKDTTGFSLREETVVNAPFEEVWHTAKHILREQGYDIYTRDKRGAFIAYTPMRRAMWMQPRRTKFSIEMARLAPNETAIAIESIRQVYGVTLLTHPGWHDRKHQDPAAAQAILEGIHQKIAEGSIVVESFLDEAPDEEDATDTSTPDLPPVLEESPLPAEQTPVVEDAETVS